MPTSFFLIVSAIASAVALFALHRNLERGRRRKSATQPLLAYPSVSIIRPIKGLDPGLAENVRAAFDFDYPGETETLFVFDDEREPGVPVVRDEIAKLRAAGREIKGDILFCGQPPANQTGKLNAMIKAYGEANNELIAFVDSDVRADRDALTRLVETLVVNAAGSAFAPVEVSLPTRTAGDAGYALLLNGMYGPAARSVAADNDGSLPFIMGQFMVMTRYAIRRIGGLEVASGQLVDDMYIGAQVHQAKLRNQMSPHPVSIIQEGMSWPAFWRLYIRWIAFSRSGLPGWSFKRFGWETGILFWLGVVGTIVSATLGSLTATVLFLLAPLGVALSVTRLHHSHGGARLPLQHLIMPIVLMLISPVIYASILFKREVEWRGRSYSLNAESRLNVQNAAPGKAKQRPAPARHVQEAA